MRAKSHRFFGVVLMIILLTAQTMGWCRAYVCECFGAPAVTVVDHCHSGLECDHFEEHGHTGHSTPCGHQCGSHRDHQVLSSRFAATSLRGERDDRKTDETPLAKALLPSLASFFQVPARQTMALDRAHLVRSDLSRRPRLTVALLI